MNYIIEAAKKSAVHEMESLLNELAHVPDDKLHWSPSPTAKSALTIAAHAAVTAGGFAVMIRERRLPTGDGIPVWVARLKAEQDALTTREAVVETYRRNTAAVLDEIDALTPEDLEMSLDNSIGISMPMKLLIALPGKHAVMHDAQIEYLQTCWDDQEIRF